MRDPQELERIYHDHRIISIQNMEPHPDGDGWIHSVYNDSKTLVGTFGTLGDAIQCAKRAKYPGMNLSTEAPEPEEIEDDPEIEEIE
jgi:hypothetical protein